MGMNKRVLVFSTLVIIGMLAGSAITLAFTLGALSGYREDIASLQSQVKELSLSERTTVPIEPGEGDNAPADWTGQTGRVSYFKSSRVGFDFVLETEGLPANKILYVYFNPVQTGQNNIGNAKKVGVLNTDQFGRGTLAGVIPLSPGVYSVGHFISDVDSTRAPFTGRTWLCFRMAVTLEVQARP